MAVTLLSLLTVACAVGSLRARTLQEKAYELRQDTLYQAELLGIGSDRLTGAVRGYAATGDRYYYEAFERELHQDRTRDRAVERLIQLGITPSERDLLELAKSRSDELVDLENQALEAAGKGDLKVAVGLVFGERYREAKQSIMQPLSQCRIELQDRLTVEAEQLSERARMLGVLGICLMIVNGATVIGALLLFYRKRVITPLSNIHLSLRALLAHEPGIEIGYQKDDSEVGEIARSLERYRAAGDEAERQRWLKNHVSDIAYVLHRAEDLQQFTSCMLGRLLPLLGGGAAAFYVVAEADGSLHFVGGYGFVPEPDQVPVFALGEGLVGQCAEEQKTLTLADLPATYLTIASGVGEASPTVLTLVPVLSLGRTLAVLELASFQSLSELQQALLEALSEVIALNLEILQRNLKTRRLAEELQGYRDSLRNSEERARSLLFDAVDSEVARRTK